MNLTTKEQEIFDSLKANGEVPLDDLVNRLGANRHALIVRVKYLASKLAPEGWIIENIGGVGRGKKAVFKMYQRG